MKKTFKTVSILGKPRDQDAIQTHKDLHLWLNDKGYQVLIDNSLQEILAELPASDFAPIADIGQRSDLAVVVGGDGNMLGAARLLAPYNTPVIGINRGNLGFLNDLDPDDFKTPLAQVLSGEYVEEQRFLLEAQVSHQGKITHRNCALNEMVLCPEQVAHMIAFEVYIDDVFAFSQRSDGLIIATPTGSTAYSLSGGGPIISPKINAMCLVPKFAHTLSSRPLVIDGQCRIRIVPSPSNVGLINVSCDGHLMLPVNSGDEVEVFKTPHPLRLIHPTSYDYYHVLRSKLGWANKLF